MTATIVQWVVAAFGAGGIGKFVYDVIRARSQGRVENSNATVNLVNSATVYADGLTKRIDSINTRFDDFRKEQQERDDARDRRDRVQAQLLLTHLRWDHRMVTELRAQGITVDEPPPLFIAEGNTL